MTSNTAEETQNTMTQNSPDTAASDAFFDRQIARLRGRASNKPMEKLVSALSKVIPVSLGHGDLTRWTQALEALPSAELRRSSLTSARLIVGAADDIAATSSALALRAQLEAFIPWRKGPFEIFGIGIDTEWRCDLKWDRLADSISPLAGRRVLDVGCGNGYYAYRMAGAGAASVLGIDPHVAYVAQFLLLQKYLDDVAVDVLPITLDDFPARSAAFDTVFSMGVLYHRRSPIDHLLQLRDSLRVGGELVLETLIVEGEAGYSLLPSAGYARMKGIWFVPTIPTLEAWLTKVGFDAVRVIDESVTTAQEQRATSWMPFESLEDSLDEHDRSRTIEGHPAPRRVVMVATRR